jgi:hypothetical protein
MSSKQPDFGMRIDTERYIALPDGHRTTLVVGMIDMLEFVVSQLAPSERARFAPILGVAGPLESGALRGVLDGYVNGKSELSTYAIASNFMVALSRKR